MPENQHAIRVGANVRAEMARRNLTQAAVAEQLNITQQKLSRCISGKQPFRVCELADVAQVLDVPVCVLLDESIEATA